MIIHPNIHGFICTTAHPTGCYKQVESQVNYIKSHGQFSGPKNVLVIGASTGYGLASRISSTFGAHANTIGVFYEKEGTEHHTASPGWYNSAAFETIAHNHGYYAKSVNGDAFSLEVKERTAELIRELKTIDLIVYSLASPKRMHPITGQIFRSVLKPIGTPLISKTVDPFEGEVKAFTIEPATQIEIEGTTQVMGGDDWSMWVDFLHKENLLSDGVVSVAYSYIGCPMLYGIYHKGTVGKAKEHLQATANLLNEKLKTYEGKAFISVNKAVVTQASAAIPGVPLYLSLLFRLLKENETEEGCVEQINRLFKQNIYSNEPVRLDHQGRIRMDNFELDHHVQQKIIELWPQVNTENIKQHADLTRYRDEFYKLFGFNIEGVNYDIDVNPVVAINSLRN